MTATGFTGSQRGFGPVGVPGRRSDPDAVRRSSRVMGSGLFTPALAEGQAVDALDAADVAPDRAPSWSSLSAHEVQSMQDSAMVAADQRLRLLRRSALFALLYSDDRLCRFWFQDLRRLALFLALMRESAWLRGGEPGSFSLTSLAQRSQMSIARTSQILGAGVSTGDFSRYLDPRDSRYLVFDPSPAARAGLERVVFAVCEAAANLLRRPNCTPALDPASMRQVCRVFVEEALSCLSEGELDDRGTGSLTFIMAMSDLALHSPIVAADFIRREAARLQVTAVTLRNVLRRAECGGWVRKKDKVLMMPAEAQEHVRRVFGGMVPRLVAVLDAADAALAAQAQTSAPGEAAE